MLQPVNAAQFMPPFGRFDETNEENVRAELARYLVLTFPLAEVPSALEAVYRAYTPSLNGHSVFPSSQYSTTQSLGYTEDTIVLGYAFPN